MPYYLYKIADFPIRLLEKIEQHDSFREASSRAKTLRTGLAKEYTIKVIFAENELQAEDTLSQVRDPIPNLGDDY